MSKKTVNNIKAIVIASILIVLTRMIDHLPWWSFVIPVIVLGIVTSLRKWNISGFSMGFLSGFAIWSVSNWYFDSVNNGILLSKMALMLSVNKLILIVISGVIGGLVTGTALYTGTSIVKRNEILTLE